MNIKITQKPQRKGSRSALTGLRDPPLDTGCSEQGKLPTAKEFKLAERDKHMSEQEKPKSFMQELDRWTEATVITPLAGADQSGEWDAAVEGVKKAIREKVLQSYRNGLKAQVKPARKEQSR